MNLLDLVLQNSQTRPTVLVLAPHTDDGEFGCGGTISRLIRKNIRVVYVAFSNAWQSLPPDFPPDTLLNEVKRATKVLGIVEEDCRTFDFPVRRFLDKRQEILDTMLALRNEIGPQVVFLPSSHDTHQDHVVIREEGFRAFKSVSMLGYEVPWNNLDFRTGFFSVLEEGDLQLKLKALACYESQKNRVYATEESIRSILVTRGLQVAAKYAEVFEVIRMVMNV